MVTTSLDCGFSHKLPAIAARYFWSDMVPDNSKSIKNYSTPQIMS
jgi:hypothetical protein